MNDTKSEQDLLTAFKASVSVFTNYTNATVCDNISNTDDAGSLDAGGWEYQTCTQMPMPMATGNNSMFLEEDFNSTAWTSFCQQKYSVTPKWDWAWETFGGANFTKDFAGYSNIMFSNGNLDPWSAGGVKSWVNYKVPYIMIKGGAHHIDLRTPNPDHDPADAVWARQ
jgi:lysosomal Pro-X carboxypeptidase